MQNNSGVPWQFWWKTASRHIQRISNTVILDQVAVSKLPGASDKSRSRIQLLQDLPFSCVCITKICFQGSQIWSVCEAWCWHGMLPGKGPCPGRAAPSLAVGVVLKVTLLNLEWHKLGGTGSYSHTSKPSCLHSHSCPSSAEDSFGKKLSQPFKLREP